MGIDEDGCRWCHSLVGRMGTASVFAQSVPLVGSRPQQQVGCSRGQQEAQVLQGALKEQGQAL
jgi:hypothetical protein